MNRVKPILYVCTSNGPLLVEEFISPSPYAISPPHMKSSKYYARWKNISTSIQLAEIWGGHLISLTKVRSKPIAQPRKRGECPLIRCFTFLTTYHHISTRMEFSSHYTSDHIRLTCYKFYFWAPYVTTISRFPDVSFTDNKFCFFCSSVGANAR